MVEDSIRTIRIRPTTAAAVEPVDDLHYMPADPADLLHADPSRRTLFDLKAQASLLPGISTVHRDAQAQSALRPL